MREGITSIVPLSPLLTLRVVPPVDMVMGDQAVGLQGREREGGKHGHAS